MSNDSEKSVDLDQPSLLVEPKRRFSKIAIGGLLGLVVAGLAAAPFLLQGGGSSDDSGSPAVQDFTKPDLGQVDATPPPPVQQVQPSPAAPDEETARRIAELEAQLRAAEEARLAEEARRAEEERLRAMNAPVDSERFNSPIIVVETVVVPAQEV